MSERLEWTLTARIEGGPELSASDSLPVDAYDQVNVTVEKGASAKEVQVQPGGAGQVKFLALIASKYDPKLTYSLKASGGTDVPLDSPQVLSGDGAVGLLGGPPSSLFFTNGVGQEVAVQIFVGRKATK